MTKLKRILSVGAIVLTLGAFSVSAMAASAYTTPAEAAAGLTGKTVEEVTAIRQETGKSYGAIAADAGKLEEFAAEMQAIREASGNGNRFGSGACDGTGECDGTGNAYGTGECDGTGICDGTGSAYGTGMGGRAMRQAKGARGAGVCLG